MEVDGLIFRRKRKAPAISPSKGQKAKLSDAEAYCNTDASEDFGETAAATPSAGPIAQGAVDEDNDHMGGSAPSSHPEDDKQFEGACGPADIDAEVVAKALLEKLPPTENEAEELQALCAEILKVRDCTCLICLSSGIRARYSIIDSCHKVVLADSCNYTLTLLRSAMLILHRKLISSEDAFCSRKVQKFVRTLLLCWELGWLRLLQRALLCATSLLHQICCQQNFRLRSSRSWMDFTHRLQH